MNCVHCKEPMVVLELDQIEIDHCLSCGGIWLDSGELEMMLGDPGEVREMLTQFAAGRDIEKGKRKCPICLKKMEVVAADKEGNLRIDRCRFNHGIWFDRGELEMVIDLFDRDKQSAIHKLLRNIFSENANNSKERTK